MVCAGNGVSFLSKRIVLSLFVVCCAGMGLAFWLPTLLYPFGRDQAAFFYIAREWLLGGVPYRDMVDHKPPLIYAVYALSHLFSGGAIWGIRLLEGVWVLLLSWVMARSAAATCEGDHGPRWLWAVSFAVLSLLYFGCFSYRETAQVEIWGAGVALLSLVLFTHASDSHLAAFAAGLAASIAVLFKPPLALLLLPLIVIVKRDALLRVAFVENSSHRWWASFAWVAGGVLVPWICVAGYFAWVGGLANLIDLVVIANWVHARSSAWDRSLWETTQFFLACISYLVPLWVATGLGFGFVFVACGRSYRQCLRQTSDVLLLFAGCLASILLQRKLYGYHWIVFVIPSALIFTRGVAQFSAWLVIRQQPSGMMRAVVPLAVMLALVVSVVGSWGFWKWQLPARTGAVAVLSGRIDRTEFLEAFSWHEYQLAEQEVIGQWLRDHSNVNDAVLVRGFEPYIYVVAERATSNRFFWTSLFVDSRLGYRQDEWRSEDWASIVSDSPRYIVALNEVLPGPDAPIYFQSLGYSPVFVHGRFTVLAK
jgi:hypothetical protein